MPNPKISNVADKYGFSKTTLRNSDGLAINGEAYLKAIIVSMGDGAPTAGNVIIYDNTTNSGTIIHSEYFTTAVFRTFFIPLDIVVNNGVYVDFTTTADVNVSFIYRQ